MKNTITFLLITILQCFVCIQAQDINLEGTWKSDDNLKIIKVNSLLNGIFEYNRNGRTIKLNLMANELPVDSSTSAISISLMNENKVISTMTGQAYIDKNTKEIKLQLFHVLNKGVGYLNRCETLFFTKTNDTQPLINKYYPPAVNISSDNLIGSWHDFNNLPGLNIIYIKDNNIYASYFYRDPNTKEEFLIKLKGYIQQRIIKNNYSFSLSGISHSFATTAKGKVNSFSMSLIGEIIDNVTEYKIKSSMNLAHAYGEKVNYNYFL